MADVNDIQGGEYELVADQWDETTSKPGETWTFVRHYKGEVLTLSQEDARRLVPSGAVREPGAAEAAQVRQLQARLAALLAQVPDELRSKLTETDPVKLAEQPVEEIPVEERRVGSPGAEIQNEGPRPRVAEASSGEGDGEVQVPTPEVGAPAVEPEKPAQAARKHGRS